MHVFQGGQGVEERRRECQTGERGVAEVAVAHVQFQIVDMRALAQDTGGRGLTDARLEREGKSVLRLCWTEEGGPGWLFSDSCWPALPPPGGGGLGKGALTPPPKYTFREPGAQGGDGGLRHAVTRNGV